MIVSHSRNSHWLCQIWRVYIVWKGADRAYMAPALILYGVTIGVNCDGARLAGGHFTDKHRAFAQGPVEPLL